MKASQKETGLVSEGKLNEVKYIVTKRPNGRLRTQQCFENCPTLTEQHTAHLTDINYLIETYKPDELAAYIAAKNQHRQAVYGVDLSKEPSFQDAKNIMYQLKEGFKALPEEIRNQFSNHIEFLKFIDNPANQEKMLRLGLMTKKEIAQTATPVTPPTQETKEPKEPK